MAGLGVALGFSAAMLGGVTVKLGNAPWATVAHWLVAMSLVATTVATLIRAGALGGDAARLGGVSAQDDARRVRRRGAGDLHRRDRRTDGEVSRRGGGVSGLPALRRESRRGRRARCTCSSRIARSPLLVVLHLIGSSRCCVFRRDEASVA